jgi:hypothetical protein
MGDHRLYSTEITKAAQFFFNDTVCNSGALKIAC